MEQTDENKVTMFDTVIECGNQHPADLATVPAVQQEFVTLTGYRADIKSKNKLINQVASGTTAHKELNAKNLINKTVYLAGPMSSFAYSTKNMELLAIAHKSASDLDSLPDTLLSDACSNIISAANLNIVALGDRGITPADITEAEDFQVEYDNSLGNKEFSFAKKKAYNESMLETIHNADDLLHNQLDKDMIIFKTKNPQFYAEYMAARVIKDLGIRHDPETPAESTTATTEQPQ